MTRVLRILLTIYGVTLAAWVALEACFLFVGMDGDLIGMGLFALLVLLAIAITVAALVRPTRRKLMFAGVALLVGAILFYSELPSRVGVPLFFAARGRAMDRFVTRILADDRITQMNDGTRHFKELNGHLVAYSAAETDVPVSGVRRREPLDSVLRQEGIPLERYHSYRQALIELDLLSFEKRDGYVAFVSDGFLDNLYGFVYVRPGHAPPALSSKFVDATDLTSLRPLGRRWYFFTTT